MNPPIVRLSDVGFSYRRRKRYFRHEYYEVLKSVSFDLYQGETLGLVGRNGCGKSTLLRLLASIFLPDSGHIMRGNLTVSMLSLSVGFDPELSGRDNIIISSMLLGSSRRQAYESVSQIIEFSELDNFVDQPVKTYSSGMRMRLGFSIAVTMKPDILLIDEVLGTGDMHFKKKSEAALLDKITSSQTVVLVSHSEAVMEKLCNRVIWLEQGAIRMEGPPREVMRSYQGAFTVDVSMDDDGVIADATLDGLDSAEASKCIAGQVRALPFYGLDSRRYRCPVDFQSTGGDE